MAETKRARNAKKEWVWTGPSRTRYLNEAVKKSTSWWIKPFASRSEFDEEAARAGARMRVTEMSTSGYSAPIGSKTPIDRPQKIERKYHEEAEDTEQE